MSYVAPQVQIVVASSSAAPSSSPVVSSAAATTTSAAPAPQPQADTESAPAPAPQPPVQTTEAPAPAPQPAPSTTQAPDLAVVPVQTTQAPAQPVVQTTDAPAPAPQPVVSSSTQAPAPVTLSAAATTTAAPQPPTNLVAACASGDMASCYTLAQSDAPPASLTAPFVRGSSPKGANFKAQCMGLANYAREHYTGAPALTWDDEAAAAAQRAADYSAQHQCSECHTESGPGYSWGQNLYFTSVGCFESYNGWVTNEALGADPANPDAGHFKNVVGTALTWSQYTKIGCAVSTTNEGATVCNYVL
ncbi:hypothetical protein BC830DRAFT_1159696 [Chytriomyces sp. MP71]|nr:hypothetical protein BC830DRAFT_1159696 [Chytriomyces sp. MP71]